MKITQILLVVVMAMVLGACTHQYPAVIEKWNDQYTKDFEKPVDAPGTGFAFRSKYDAAAGTDASTVRRHERDRILAQLVSIVDQYHRDIEIRLTVGRASEELLMDAGQLTLNGLGAVTGTEAVKAALAAAAGGLKGFQSAVDSRVFAEKTNAAILSAMQADWIKNRGAIEVGMTKSDEHYSLDQGLVDWSRFATEGNLTDALAKLQDAANEKKNQAETKVSKDMEEAHKAQK